MDNEGICWTCIWKRNSSSSVDGYIEGLLDRISNGVLAEVRRNAMVELQSVVSESHATQLAFGAIGALRNFIHALTAIHHTKGPKNEVQPALSNSNLLCKEVDSISLLISLLSDEDFYVQYYMLQLMTALVTNSWRFRKLFSPFLVVLHSLWICL